MSVRDWVVIGACAASVGIALGFEASRLAHARSRADAARGQLSVLVKDITEVIDLRTRRERVGVGQRPQQDTITLVGAALSSAGLPSATLRDLAPQSDSSLSTSPGAAGPAYRRQTMRLTLEPITPRELGEFFKAWRETQSVWTVGQVELVHSGRDEDSLQQYRASLSICATYVDGSPGERSEGTK